MEGGGHGGRRRPGGELRLPHRLQGTGTLASAAVVHEDPDAGLRLKGLACRGHVRCIRVLQRRGRLGRSARQLAVEQRGQGVEERRLLRHLLGYIDVEELQPPADRPWAERVGVSPVDHRRPDPWVPGECRHDGGPLPPGLLVLERPREEDRDLGLGGPRSRSPLVVEAGVTMRCLLQHGCQILGLAMELLIGQARCIPLLDQRPGIDLAARGSRLGIRDPIEEP